MRITTPVIAVILVASGTASNLAAQDRPFLFSVSTPRADQPHLTAHIDARVGDRSVRSDAARSLPAANRDGYAVRASLTYGF